LKLIRNLLQFESVVFAPLDGDLEGISVAAVEGGAITKLIWVAES